MGCSTNCAAGITSPPLLLRYCIDFWPLRAQKPFTVCLFDRLLVFISMLIYLSWGHDHCVRNCSGWKTKNLRRNVGTKLLFKMLGSHCGTTRHLHFVSQIKNETLQVLLAVDVLVASISQLRNTILSILFTIEGEDTE